MGCLWFIHNEFIEFVDGALFVVEEVEGHVLFVISVSLKYGSYELKCGVKFTFDSGVAVSLSFAA